MNQNINNILCVRLDSLGDVLMTTPAMLAVRHHFPEANITLLTSPSGAGLSAFLPGVDECMVYNAPWMKSSRIADQGAYDSMVATLRDRRFDTAFIFTVYSQNPLPAAMMCAQAKIPERVAFCRENPYELLTHWAKDEEPFALIRHEVQRQLDLVSWYGCKIPQDRMQLNLDTSTLHTARRKLHALGILPTQPYVVLHPGATAPSRRYSLEGFIEIAKLVIKNTSLPVLITGSPDEADLGHTILAAIEQHAFNAAGELTTAEFAATVQNAHFVISNNTSTVHIASACGTPVVDIYALTNPQHTPWMVPSRIMYKPMPCGFCYRSQCLRGDNACINQVTPEQITAAAQDLMDEIATTNIRSTALYNTKVIDFPGVNVNPFIKREPQPQSAEHFVQNSIPQRPSLVS